MVQVYAPDTTYDVNNDDRGDYSQELGRKAATIVGAVTNDDKWSIVQTYVMLCCLYSSRLNDANQAGDQVGRGTP